jgi:threonine/homoserine/homoserine lactone efflux protein
MIAELGLYTLTIAAVSLTPGLCMTLAFTLGMTVGYRRSLWMMLGELLGVATVFTATFWSLSWLLNQNPIWFVALSLGGGTYLLYLAITLFKQPANAIRTIESLNTRWYQLAGLGFITAIGNPKGWAFLVALLPGFITTEIPMGLQYTWMLAIMMVTEFSSMSIYAVGGRWIASKLSDADGPFATHRVVALLLGAVSIWVFSGALMQH